MKRTLTIFAVVFLVLTASGVLLAQGEPFNGTWKLNVTKSKYSAGLPLKSDSRTYDSSSDGVKVTVERVTGDGSKQQYGINAKYDGKDYPITGQGPFGADTISYKMRTDSSTTVATLKKSGSKLRFTTTSVVSRDGKALTLTSKGVDSDGKPLDAVLVYDKQ
jgi:hypothetical protein